MHYKLAQQFLELYATKLNCIKLNEPFRNDMRDSWNGQTVRSLNERLYSHWFTEAGIKTSLSSLQLSKTDPAQTENTLATTGKVLKIKFHNFESILYLN